MNKIVVAVVLLLGIANALPQPNPHSPQGYDGGSKHLGFDHKHINHRGISGNRGIKGFGRNHPIGKREASAEPNPRSPNGFAVGGFQSVQPARPIKGGGLGGYHGFKGFGGVHYIGKREASAEPSPRSPNGFAVGGFQSVQPARPIKGGGLGGYHGFKGFGGVHTIGKREADPRSPFGTSFVSSNSGFSVSQPNHLGGLGGHHGLKSFGVFHQIGKREASAEPKPRSPNGFAVGGFQSVPPARPIKGGGLGGYHGFKGFGGVHHIGKREASAEPSPRSPSGFAVGGFQSVPSARPIKGGGLGGYHGFKGFGGVHTVG